MREVCLVPTFRRNAYLHCCLKRIRVQDANLDIVVFSDRGEDNPELRTVCETFGAKLRVTPVHQYHGNSFQVMEAFRWAVEHYDLIHVTEDDTMQHPDCLAWHREQHADLGDILFASCGWVFNQHAPITEDVMFANWYYAPNACFARGKLLKVVQHANPLYYNAMAEYTLKTFPNSVLHCRKGRKLLDTAFFEQDAIIQFCLMEDGSQVAWCASAKVNHVGSFGYNKPAGERFEGSLEEQIAQIEELIADPYRRAELFGREIVEREVGKHLEKRERTYRLELPGGWTSLFRTERACFKLGEWINSVPVTPEMKMTLESTRNP